MGYTEYSDVDLDLLGLICGFFLLPSDHMMDILTVYHIYVSHEGYLCICTDNRTIFTCTNDSNMSAAVIV